MYYNKRTTKSVQRLYSSTTLELTFLVLPSAIFIIIFNYIPLYGLLLPFENYSPIKGLFRSEWVGISNFDFLFTSNTLWTITRNTVLMNFLFIIFNTIFSVIFALFLFDLSRRFVKLYQTIMFFPYFMSWVIVSYVFLGFLDPDRGILNKMITLIGGEQVLWYSEPKFWPFILVLASVWKTAGYGAIIYYAGLVGNDPEYYEAAKIDGATKLQQMRHISIPLITPIITIVNILAIGKVFYGDIGIFYNVTMNSPFLYPTTDVIDTYVLRALKTLNDIGMSSAAGLYQAVCGFILVIVTNMTVRRISAQNSLF